MSRDPAQHKLDAWPLTVWCAATKGELRKVGKALGIADQLRSDNGGVTHSHLGPLGFHNIVWVDVKNHSDRLGLVDTCAHEASHVVDGLFEYVEEERPGTETRAYLVGWITRWLLEHCEPPA